MSKQHAISGKRSLPSPRMRKEKSATSPAFLPHIVSLGIYFISLCVISLAASYFLNQGSDPKSHVALMSMVATALSSAIASGYLCRATDKSPFVCGITVSVTVILLSVIFSLIFGKYATEPIYMGILLKAPLFFSSFLGGVIGKKRNNRRGRCCGR